MLLIDISLLLLIGIANGAPILVARLLGKHLAWPVDDHRKFIDGQALFGRRKTWRGVLVAILSAWLIAPLLGLSGTTGLLIGVFCMLGDLFSSFIKRRLQRPPSSQALGLDQIPECLFPLLAVESRFALGWLHITLLVVVLIILELALSRILYQLKIREQPY